MESPGRGVGGEVKMGQTAGKEKREAFRIELRAGSGMQRA